MGSVIGLVVVSWWALANHLHWVLVPALAVLGAYSVLNNKNPLLYWPVGLLLIIVASYVFYWIQWLGAKQGVTLESAESMFAIMLAGFGLFACGRAWFSSSSETKRYSLARLVSLLIMVALPVVLVWLVTTRWMDDPVRLISGHLAGGDHGPHNEIVHRLLSASNEVTYSSPIQMYTYPNGIHFLIANLVAFASVETTLPLLAQEYAMGAWFEWLQFAAFAQMAVVLVMKGVRGNPLRRAVYLAPVFFVFATMDNFVSHLLWSGFTTSLGMTWLLVTFLAIADRLSLNNPKDIVATFSTLMFFAYASWIVYQPYSFVFVAMAGFASIQLLCRDRRQLFGFDFQRIFGSPGLSVLVVMVALVAAMLGVLGKNSPAVTSLLLDGATYKPYFYTVWLWTFVALAGTWFLSERPLERMSMQMRFLLIHAGFVGGMILTVMIAGGFGLLEQPYYTQKMLWILLFVSLPVGVSRLFTWMERAQEGWPISKRFGLATVVMIGLLFTPLVQGRYPVSATRKHNVDWFAKAMVQQPDDSANRAVAFSWVDRLGSHLSNLALRSTSSIVMPVETGTSGNTYLACRFINNNEASLVYTTPNGRAELVEAGCDDGLQYMENGQRIENPVLNYQVLPLSTRQVLARGEPGFVYLVRGFLPPEDWGTWAGGYRSMVAFRSPADLDAPELVIGLRKWDERDYDRLIIRVNGEVARVVSVGNLEMFETTIDLSPMSRGEAVEVTFECERSDEEVLADDPVDGPDACIGVRQIELR